MTTTNALKGGALPTIKPNPITETLGNPSASRMGIMLGRSNKTQIRMLDVELQNRATRKAFED